MARQGSVLDKYPQWALLEVPGAAAAAGVSIQRLVTGITTMQKVGWEVCRIEYRLPSFWKGVGFLTINTELIFLGVMQSNSLLQNANLNNPSLLDFVQFDCQEEVTAAGESKRDVTPVVHDFGQDPILAIPANLHAMLSWTTGANLDTSLAQIRLWYREVELGPEDWYDLLQLRLPLGAI